MVKTKHSKSTKYILLFFIIAILSIIAFFQLKTILLELWPTESVIQTRIVKLKHLQKQLKKQLRIHSQYERDKEYFRKYAQGFWIEERDGPKETGIQGKIKEIAAKAGLPLASLGRVNSSKISDGVYSLDIMLSAQSAIAPIADFLLALYKERKPRFYWATIKLRPDSMFKPKNVVLSGSLRLISISDKELIDFILNKKKKNSKD